MISLLDLREFGDWPRPHRAATCALALLLAAALPWMLLTRPALAESQVLAAAIQDMQARLAAARQQMDNTPSLPAAPVPAPPHLPSLMTALHAAAQAAGVRDGQFRPMPSRPAGIGTDAEFPTIELHLSGTWPQLSQFAATLAAPGRDALLGLHGLHLRAHAAPTLLELTAQMRIYPRPATAHASTRAHPGITLSARNPFADTRAPTTPPRAPLLIGSLGSEHGHTGLVLTADGHLRRGHRPPSEAAR